MVAGQMDNTQTCQPVFGSSAGALTSARACFEPTRRRVDRWVILGLVSISTQSSPPLESTKMVLSYQLYQQPLDPLGQDIDRFWSVLFTADSRNLNDMMVEDSAFNNNAFPSSSVYIGGLHASFSEAHLAKLLMPFGKIEHMQLTSQEGCAICAFADPRSAQFCMQKLNGRMLLGRSLCIAPAPNSCGRAKRPLGEDTMNYTNTVMDMASSPIRAIRRKLNDDAYYAY